MRWLKTTLSFGISLLFIYLTFFIPQPSALFGGRADLASALFGHSRFNLAELGQVLASANWLPIVWAGIVFSLTMVIRAWRWQVMLEPLVKMRFIEVFSAMSIGYMANNVLPLRMGEVYRAQVIYQLSGLSRSAAFGSIVLERVTDLFFMLPFMAAAFLMFPLPGPLQQAAYVVGAGAVGISAFCIWVIVDRSRALALAGYVLRLLPRRACAVCTDLLDRFTSGLSALGKSKRLLGIAVASIALWAMYAAMVYCVLDALHFLDSGLELIERSPLAASLVTLIITTIGFVIPGAPGAVGTYHGVAVMGLSLFEVPGNLAAGFAILLHALNYIPLTLIGLIFFWRLGLTFRQTNPMTLNLNMQDDRGAGRASAPMD